MDYPLWREQLRKDRSLFDNVIIIFTDMNVPIDYREFVAQAMLEDRVIFLDNPPVTARDDWRNVATRKALRFTRQKWIFFTEQDFFWKEGFWPVVGEAMGRVEYIRALVGDRVHPCCLFLTRDLLNKTNRDFGVIKDVSDHFSKIQNELVPIEAFDIPQDLWFHFGGLSQNMFLLSRGEEPNYMPAEFKKYCEDCLNVSVPMHEDFVNLFKGYLSEH